MRSVFTYFKMEVEKHLLHLDAMQNVRVWKRPLQTRTDVINTSFYINLVDLTSILHMRGIFSVPSFLTSR